MPKPIDKIGNHLYDFGIEFKTRQFGDLNLLIAKIDKRKTAIDPFGSLAACLSLKNSTNITAFLNFPNFY